MGIADLHNYNMMTEIDRRWCCCSLHHGWFWKSAAFDVVAWVDKTLEIGVYAYEWFYYSHDIVFLGEFLLRQVHKAIYNFSTQHREMISLPLFYCFSAYKRIHENFALHT